MKKILTLILSTVLVLSLAACGGNKNANEDKNNTNNPAVGKDIVSENTLNNLPKDPDILASIEGTDIKKEDIASTVKLLSYVYSLEGQEPDKDMIENYALQYYITSKIYDSKLKEYNLTISDEEIQTQLEEIAKDYDGGLEALETSATEAGVTIDELKGIVRSDLSYAAVENYLTKDITISDEDCKKYFDEHPDEFIIAPRRDFNQITYETEEEAKMAIEAIQSGTSFDSLAKSRNETLGSDENGLMATVANGELSSDFNDIVFSLADGQVYDTPIKTEKGYHVVMANNFTESQNLAYDDVIEDLRSYLKASEADSILSEMFNKAYEDMQIQVYKASVTQSENK